MDEIRRILAKKILNKIEIMMLLEAKETDQKTLFAKASEVRKQEVGNKVYLRGLIEFSNICSKDCFYCGIRKSNSNVIRYNLSDDEILEAVCFAHGQNFASIVLQSGELSSSSFTRRIENLIKKIHQKTNSELHITLSLGEQDEATYKRWFESGAHRYLLRIETSNSGLYKIIHPNDKEHSYSKRRNALDSLKKMGYQTGTGVMIGLPFQTHEDLADDLMFMKDFGIDMAGMGPYIEHSHTPLYSVKDNLLPLGERFFLTLKMIAVLRLLMPKINIAAATALQAIDNLGREKALMAGANVFMPNMTPGKYRYNYQLYDNKPCTDQNADDCADCLEARIAITGNEIGFGEWGDSKFYQERRK